MGAVADDKLKSGQTGVLGERTIGVGVGCEHSAPGEADAWDCSASSESDGLSAGREGCRKALDLLQNRNIRAVLDTRAWVAHANRSGTFRTRGCRDLVLRPRSCRRRR